MMKNRFREGLAVALDAAVAATTAHAFSAPAPATLQGTVIAAAPWSTWPNTPPRSAPAVTAGNSLSGTYPSPLRAIAYVRSAPLKNVMASLACCATPLPSTIL